MSNKRPLKSFIRYDGSGRAVSSSLIWRKNKPKVGNWKEVQGYECCNPGGGGCGEVFLIVPFRYALAVCGPFGSFQDYRVYSCNGTITLKTTSGDPVPNGYYEQNGTDLTFNYLVEDSIVVEAVPPCP